MCAVLAGARSFIAIGDWVSDASEQVRAALGLDQNMPSESCVRRTLQCLDGDQVDTAIGSWAAGHPLPSTARRRVIAVDGKRIRGSCSAITVPWHLLGALDHHRAVVLARNAMSGTRPTKSPSSLPCWRAST